MDTPTPQPPASPYYKPMTLALAGIGLVLTVTLTTLFAKLPTEYSMWNATVIGALALFAAARLGFWQGVLITALAIALKDVCLYFATPWWEPYPLSWLYFTGYAVVGWFFLRRSESIGRAAVAGFGTGFVFFLISNFVSWLEQAYPYGYSLAGLLDCYKAALPFYRGTATGDILFTVAFFGAHAVLSHAYFPKERVSMVPVKVEEEELW